MTQYNTVNVRLSASQLKRLKSVTQNAADVTLTLYSNMIGDDGANFPQRLLLTDRQVASLHKAFANKLLTNIKFSKVHLSKIIQLSEFLGRYLGPLMRVGLLWMKNVLQSSAKSVLIQLG